MWTHFPTVKLVQLQNSFKTGILPETEVMKFLPIYWFLIEKYVKRFLFLYSSKYITYYKLSNKLNNQHYFL